MVDSYTRELTFGDPSMVPRICCPQVWTVQVEEKKANAAAVLGSLPAHVVHATTKLQEGMFALATMLKNPITNKVMKAGSVGEPIDLRGIKGKIVGVADTIDCSGRQQLVDSVSRTVSDETKRVRLGPFPRDWFLPDKIKTAKKKLPLFPKSVWFCFIGTYGEVENAWILFEGTKKVFLIVNYAQAVAVNQILADSIGRYISMPRVQKALPMDITLVGEDDLALNINQNNENEIPTEIMGCSTTGMDVAHYNAFQQLITRVDMLEKDNKEMQDLLRDLTLADQAAQMQETHRKKQEMKQKMEQNKRRTSGIPIKDGKAVVPPRQVEVAPQIQEAPPPAPWKTQHRALGSNASAPLTHERNPNLNMIPALQQHPQRRELANPVTLPPAAKPAPLPPPDAVPWSSVAKANRGAPDWSDSPQKRRTAASGAGYGHEKTKTRKTQPPTTQPPEFQEALKFADDNAMLTKLALGEISEKEAKKLVPPPPNARRQVAGGDAPWKQPGIRKRKEASAPAAPAENAPWKKLRTDGTARKHPNAPKTAVEKEDDNVLNEKDINEYHNLLLGN